MNPDNLQVILALSTLIGTLVTVVSVGVGLLTVRENRRLLAAQAKHENAEALAADGTNAQAVSTAWQTAMRGVEEALERERQERKQERERFEVELNEERAARESLEARLNALEREKQRVAARLTEFDVGVRRLLAQLSSHQITPVWTPTQES